MWYVHMCGEWVRWKVGNFLAGAHVERPPWQRGQPHLPRQPAALEKGCLPMPSDPATQTLFVHWLFGFAPCWLKGWQGVSCWCLTTLLIFNRAICTMFHVEHYTSTAGDSAICSRSSMPRWTL